MIADQEDHSWCCWSSFLLVPRKELYQMLARKIEVCRLIRAAGEIQPQCRRPGVSQALDCQRSHFRSLCTIPHFFPSTRMHFINGRLGPLTRVLRFASISLYPLPPPQSRVCLRPEAAAQRRTSVKGCDGIFDTMGVKYRHGVRRCTIIKGVSTLIKRRRDRSESCKDGRCIWSTGEQRRESATVGHAACVNTRLVDTVGRRNG